MNLGALAFGQLLLSMQSAIAKLVPKTLSSCLQHPALLVMTEQDNSPKVALLWLWSLKSHILLHEFLLYSLLQCSTSLTPVTFTSLPLKTDSHGPNLSNVILYNCLSTISISFLRSHSLELSLWAQTPLVSWLSVFYISPPLESYYWWLEWHYHINTPNHLYF